MLLVLGVYLLTMSGHTYSPDDETMLAASRSLVERGTWAIQPASPWVYTQGVDGRYYSVFGAGQSFAAVPWVAAGLALGDFFPKDQAGFPLRLILSTYNALIAAGVCGLLAATGMALGYARRASLFMGGALAFATFLWPHSRTFFAEPVVALCFLASFYLIIKAYQAPAGSISGANTLMLLSGVLFAGALQAKVQYAVALPAFLLYLAMKGRGVEDGIPARLYERGRRIPLWLGGLAVGLVPMFIYNWALFGNPLLTGYGTETASLFTTPLYEGAFGMLLSPGKGVVWYALPVLLSLAGYARFARKHRAEAALTITLLVTFISFFGLFHTWYGGGSWGPRYLIPWLPFALLLALPVVQRASYAGSPNKLSWKGVAIAACVALGFLLNLPGVLVNFDTYLNAGDDDDTRNWYPAASPLVGHYKLLGERLKVREGLLTLLKPPGTLILKSGFSYSEGSKARRELLPRWTTGNGGIEFHADLSKGPVQVTLRLSDNRPPEMERAAVTILADNQPVPVQTAPVEDSPASTDYTFPITRSLTRIEVRSETWNPAASGVAERNEDLGVRLESITVNEGGVVRPYEMVEDLPVPPYYPQPRWYYNPDTQHPADLWFVYMAEAGIGRRTMLAIVAPILLASLLCIFFGVRGLRREEFSQS